MPTPNITRHARTGGWKWLANARMPKESAEIERELYRFRDELYDYCGGPQRVTPVQRGLILGVVRALGYCLLCDKYIDDHQTGVVQGEKGPELISCLNEKYLAFQRMYTGLLQKLEVMVGRNRAEKGPQDPHEYYRRMVEARDKEHERPN